MIQQILSRTVIWLLASALLVLVVPSQAQNRQQREDQQRHVAEQLRLQRLNRFIDDVHLLYEASGELVSFRVRPEMTRGELRLLSDRSKDLDRHATRIISYIENIAPFIRGYTDDLWIIRTPGEDSTLEDRLTVILALIYRVEPKIDHLIDLMSGEGEPAIELEDLQVEASLPYLVVGGLQVIKDLTIELRGSL